MMSVIKRSAREAGVAALLDDRRSGVPVGKRHLWRCLHGCHKQ